MWQGSGQLPADYGDSDRAPRHRGGQSTILHAGEPETLWNTDPDRRGIGVLGFVTGTMAGGEDEVIAIARGARTSFKNRIVEDRATIRGGVAVLHSAGIPGYEEADPKALSSKILQGHDEDARLVRAAKGGRDVRSAADYVRLTVREHGLERAAWGARGLYHLANLSMFGAMRGVSAGVTAVLGPVGAIIGAAMAGHGAISASVAKNLSVQFQQYVREGLARHREKREASPPPPPPPASESFPPWLLWVGGAAAVGLVLVAASQRKP